MTMKPFKKTTFTSFVSLCLAMGAAFSASAANLPAGYTRLEYVTIPVGADKWKNYVNLPTVAFGNVATIHVQYAAAAPTGGNQYLEIFWGDLPKLGLSVIVR